MNWTYNDEEFTSDMIGDNYGFVYEIKNIQTGMKYIGKKFFWSKRTLPPLKGNTRKRHRVVESDWLKYWSSCKPLLADVAKLGRCYFTREIISLHANKTETNLAELQRQVLMNTLDAVDPDDNRLYYNANIERIYYPSERFRVKRNTLFNKTMEQASAELDKRRKAN